jgi:LmbE family N-acetylglucosaminyl deacetylase
MNKLPQITLFLFCLNFSTLPCLAQDVKPMQEFTNNDRILILAPHPDDEVMAAGGVIQKALKVRARVKVLFLTNGDHNEPAFIVYEKRLTMRRGEFIHMGQVRRRESLGALNKLGIS